MAKQTPIEPVELTADELEQFKTPAIEQRSAAFDDVELTELPDGELIFEGHAAVFDTTSDDLGGFRETIRRGAFRSALASSPDVDFLGLDHNDRQPMARSTVRSGPGSLALKEDPTGLAVRAHLVKTQAAVDLAALIEHRVVTDMSFGFRVQGGGEATWSHHPEGYVLRTISKFARLLDVSPAGRSRAYPGTAAAMRSLACGVELVDAAGEVQRDELVELAWRIHRGERDATADERRVIDAVFDRIETVSPWIAERALRATSLEPELRASIPGKVATVTLEDAIEGGAVVHFRLAARRRRLRALGVKTD